MPAFGNSGASTLRLPAVEIRAFGKRRETAAQIGALGEFDVIIFTSANAVRFGVSLLDQQRDLTLAAVGPATARALNHAGYRVAIQPQGASTPRACSNIRVWNTRRAAEY